MPQKQPFDEFMRDFTLEHGNEIEKLTHEQIAERTGYSLTTVRDYFQRQEKYRRYKQEQDEAERIRALEAGAVTYNTSSGSAHVTYYPLIGEVKITSTLFRKQTQWGFAESRETRLSPQDTFEIGIYLLGLQPHLRDILSRKEELPQVMNESSNLLATQEDEI